jgi:hypothetical protein
MKQFSATGPTVKARTSMRARVPANLMLAATARFARELGALFTAVAA